MKKWLVWLIAFGMMVVPAMAHPGGTDGSGGHYNRSTGEYHYHHGYGAHDHVDGVCPYDYDDKTGERLGSSGGDSYNYASYAAAEDWYDEYCDAQEARRAAEKELQEMKNNQIRNLALSAVAGLSGGLSVLIMQIRASRRRFEETEQRLLQHEAEAIARTKSLVAAEWAPQLRIAESQNRDLLKRLDDVSNEQLNEEKQRQANSVMFAKMARDAKFLEQSIVYAERVVKNTAEIPPNEAVVYVPMDLRSDVYHREYIPCGVRNMVLASKKHVEEFGMKPCPRCDHAALPVSDYTVCAALRNTQVYHRVNSFCSSYQAREMPLSEAIQRGLRPCAKCNPPSENPKIWF